MKNIKKTGLRKLINNKKGQALAGATTALGGLAVMLTEAGNYDQVNSFSRVTAGTTITNADGSLTHLDGVGAKGTPAGL